MNPRFVFALSLSSLAASLLAAQTAAPRPPAEETVLLSPFEVVADEQRGYATSSSLSLSRVATAVIEIPVSAITINEKLIEDTVATTLADTFELVSGVQASSSQDSSTSNDFSIRGYSMSSALRDGVNDSLFSNSGGFDYSFVQRIEIAKGPNGILYGNHAPGGVVNIISKRPLPKPRTKIRLIAGSDHYRRAELDSSNFFDASRRFSYRIAAATTDHDGPVDHPGYPRKANRAINPSFLYRGPDGLQLWVWSAFVRATDSRPQYMTRGVSTDLTRGGPGNLQIAGAGYFDRKFIDEGGGNHVINSYNQTDTDNYEVGGSRSFEFRGIELDLRLLARYRSQFSDNGRVRGIGSDNFIDAAGASLGTNSRSFLLSTLEARGLTGIYRDGGLRYDIRLNDTTSYNYNLDAVFKFAVGPVRQSLLLQFGVYNDRRASDTSNVDIAPTNTAGQTALRELGYTVTGTRSFVWIYPNALRVEGITRDQVTARANVVNTLTKTLSDTDGYNFGVMDRVALLERRVFLVGGANLAVADTKTRIVANNIQTSVTQQYDRTWTPGFGAVGKIYKGDRSEAALFTNFNQTYTPVFRIDTRLATFGHRLPNRRAKTKEAGVKLDLFKNRVIATASVFDSSETNALVTLNDNSGAITGLVNNSYQAPVGSRTTKGFEFDLNLQPLRGLDVLLSYSHVDAMLEDGTIPPAIADNTAAVMVRYEVRRGLLKGASCSWTCKYWGESFMNVNTPLWVNPSGELHSAVVGYTYKNWSASLRVSNVFDVLRARPSQSWTSLGVTTPRDYRVSFGYTF